MSPGEYIDMGKCDFHVLEKVTPNTTLSPAAATGKRFGVIQEDGRAFSQDFIVQRKDATQGPERLLNPQGL